MKKMRRNKMVLHKKIISSELLVRTQERLKTLYESISCTSYSSSAVDGGLSPDRDVHGIQSMEFKSVSCTSQTLTLKSLSDEDLTFLYERIETLRNKVNLMMNKMLEIPSDVPDDNQQIVSEIEILKEMEEINLEILSLSYIIKEHDGKQSVMVLNLEKQPSTINNDVEIGSKSNTRMPSYRDYEKETNQLNPCESIDLGINSMNTNAMPSSRSVENRSMNGSIDLEICGYNNRNDESSEIEKLRKENESLIKKLKETQNEMRMIKIKGIIFKHLSKKIYKICQREESKQISLSTSIKDRVTKINSIINKSFELPPFVETIEVFKSICLFIMEHLQFSEQQLAKTTTLPPYKEFVSKAYALLKERIGKKLKNSQPVEDSDTISISNEKNYSMDVVSVNKQFVQDVQEKIWGMMNR